MKKRYDQIEIKNLADYMQILSKEDDEKLLFRGHKNSSWELVPRLVRESGSVIKETSTSFFRIEQGIIDEFKRRLPSFIQKTDLNFLELISLGQHYGLNTRLLDWTENPIVALWFSLQRGYYLNENNKDSSIPACVWMLKYKKSDILNINKLNPTSLKKIGRTRILFPPQQDRRHTSQSSVFTLHALPLNGIFIPMEKNRFFIRKLTKIIISAKLVISLKREVRRLATNQSIYQDLGSMCLDINEKFEDEIFVKMRLS
jgi:hypothetical protein